MVRLHVRGRTETTKLQRLQGTNLFALLALCQLGSLLNSLAYGKLCSELRHEIIRGVFRFDGGCRVLLLRRRSADLLHGVLAWLTALLVAHYNAQLTGTAGGAADC